MNILNKQYISPELEILKVEIVEEVIMSSYPVEHYNSQTGGGMFDNNPTDPIDDDGFYDW